MKTVVVTQARMGSTRLPGKILKTVLGKTLLEYQIERLRRVKNADDVVVATTTVTQDDVLAQFCKERHITCFRGSEADVLSRYVGAAQASQADLIVRVTSDCPLIDPLLIDKTISLYREGSASYDYVSNILERTYPRGLDCEVFSRALLENCMTQDLTASEHEHVTAYIYRHPEKYKLGSLRHTTDCSQHRWTVDTPEDFELIRRILEAVYPKQPNFGWLDCLQVVEQHPEWDNLNSHVKQRIIL